jgi:2-polyprenyl-3-methyl-5-hydroxy-6-metoxy-1,4-benzoquinol methylase
MSDQITKYFSKNAGLWRDIYDRKNLPFFLLNLLLRKGIFDRWNLVFESCPSVAGKTVLDVGCGSGLFSLHFAALGAKRAVGLDIAPGMIDMAKAQAKQRGLDSKCEFMVADFMKWDSPELFDVVYAIGVLEYIPDPAPFLRKMAQKSRSLVLASFPAHDRLREPLRKIRYKIKKFPVYFHSEKDLLDLAAKAGIKKTQIIPYASSGLFLKGSMG